MTQQETIILGMAKVDLQISTTAYDLYIGQLIQTAEERIKTEGITLRDEVPDNMLVAQYAAYLFRQRRDGAGMPRMLRYALNNRLFSEKAGEDNG